MEKNFFNVAFAYRRFGFSFRPGFETNPFHFLNVDTQSWLGEHPAVKEGETVKYRARSFVFHFLGVKLDFIFAFLNPGDKFIEFFSFLPD